MHDFNSDPFLSIVIVSWNTKQVLQDCLESVVKSVDVGRSEIFVVDNASTDGSPEMVESTFRDVRLIRNTQNLGFAAANNQALVSARGRFVLLLNPDTVVLGDVINRTVDFLTQNPRVGVTACRVLNEDGTVQATCFMAPSLVNIMLKASGLFKLKRPRFLGREHLSDWNRDSEREVDVVTGCYMMVRKTAIEAVGLLDERFFFCGEETDWCTRFREAGWEVRFSPVGEIIHLGNQSGRQLDAKRDLLLTEGLVKYHNKHHGRLSAVLAWTLLAAFSVSRLVYWYVVDRVRSTPRSQERHGHFASVVRGYSSTWRATG